MEQKPFIPTRTWKFIAFLAFLVILALCAKVTAAQGLGIIAGPMVTTYNNKVAIRSTGIAAGVSYQGRKLTGQALYEQKGGRYGRIDETDNYKLRMDYVTATATVKVLPVLWLGGYASYLLDKVQARYMFDETKIDWLATHWIARRIDAGAVADLRIPLPPTLSAGLRYEYGITPVGRYSWAPLYRQHNTNLHAYLIFNLN